MTETEKEVPVQQVTYVEISKINVPRERVTSVWDPNLLAEIEESIRAKGILEPVQLLDINGALWLTDGLHRIQIAEKLKISKVPALIKKGSTEDLLIENLIRNRQRGKSNPAEEAEVLDYLVNNRKFPLVNAAKQIGMSEAWARKLIRISTLPEETKDLIKHGKIPVTGAFYIVDLPTPQLKLSVSRDAALYGYNAHQIKARVWQFLNPDQEPNEGGTTFTPEGKPQEIPIRCKYCGDPLSKVGKEYIWVCKKCEELTKQLYDYYRDKYLTTPPSPPGPPQTPPEP